MDDNVEYVVRISSYDPKKRQYRFKENIFLTEEDANDFKQAVVLCPGEQTQLFQRSSYKARL